MAKRKKRTTRKLTSSQCKTLRTYRLPHGYQIVVRKRKPRRKK